MKNKILPSITLGTICLVVALLLALVNTVTGPKILENSNNKADEALAAVLPGHSGFTIVEIPDNFPSTIDFIRKSKEGGYVFRANVVGKSSGMTVMVGIDQNGAIAGTKCTANNETPGYKERVFDLTDKGEDGHYYGMTRDTVEYLIVAKSTMTSEAYATAVKDALNGFAILGGGEVDLRTEEEILNDNLNAALGTTDKTFEKWFATEVTDADAIYSEIDGDGTVVVLGEVFVGIKNGAVVTEGIEEATASSALSAYTVYNTATEAPPTELTVPEEYGNNVLKAYVTASGNYVFELKAAGYGILGGSKWHPASGEYIYIKIAIDADGAIISTLTVSQAESEGFGDKCASSEYYDQFSGLTDSDIVITDKPVEDHPDDPGVIAGATLTTNGYQKALKVAFELFNLLKGGNEP